MDHHNFDHDLRYLCRAELDKAMSQISKLWSCTLNIFDSRSSMDWGWNLDVEPYTPCVNGDYMSQVILIKALTDLLEVKV